MIIRARKHTTRSQTTACNQLLNRTKRKDVSYPASILLDFSQHKLRSMDKQEMVW